jgi:hypothetical protein
MKNPKHPYPRGHLRKIWRSLVRHAGTCANCRPVDPDNPTDAELEVLFRCPYCDGGSVETRAAWGKARKCDACGGRSYPVFNSRSYALGSDAATETRAECLNCRIQTHADYCRSVDENDDLIPCVHGWPEGS